MGNTRIIDLNLDEFQEVIKEIVQQNIKEALIEKESGDELLTRNQVMKKLHISASTLAIYTKNGILKSYYIGHRVYYKWSEILSAGSTKIL